MSAKEWTFAVHANDHATYRLGADEDLWYTTRTEPFLAMDIETGDAKTFRRWNIKAVSVSTTQKAWVLDPVADAQAIQDTIRNAKGLVFHNAPYDVPILVRNGFMTIADINKVHDTILLSRLAQPSDHGGNTLGDVADRVVGPGYKRAKLGVENMLKKVTRAKTKGQVFDMLGLESPAYVMYAGFDTIITARVFEALPAAVAAHHSDHKFSIGQYATSSDVIQRETTVMRVLLRRSARGLLVADDEGIDTISRAFTARIDKANTALAGFGIDIDATDAKARVQVMATLDSMGVLGPRWKRNENGSPSGDKKALGFLPHPLAQEWLSRAEASNYLNKFVDGYFATDNGRVYPSVSVGAAVTGRMSYSGPPLQQIPPEVRPMIRSEVPITSFDWSSIEPVLLFNAAKETALIEGFEAGGDLYQPIADMASVKRKQAKQVLLAQMYGQGIARLAAGLDVSEDEARILKAKVQAAMPNASRAIRMVSAICKEQGRILTMYGRNIPVEPDPTTGNKMYKGYQGVNYLIQGSAYDMLADAIVNLEKAGAGDSIVLAIHDELVVEADAADITQEVMTTPPEWLIAAVDRTPVLRVGRSDLGYNWADKS